MVFASKQTSEAALGCQTASTSQHWLMVSCFRMGCNVRLTVLGHISVHDYPRSSYHRMQQRTALVSEATWKASRGDPEHGDRRGDDEVVVAVAWALNPARSSSWSRSNSANFFSLSLEDRISSEIPPRAEKHSSSGLRPFRGGDGLGKENWRRVGG